MKLTTTEFANHVVLALANHPAVACVYIKPYRVTRKDKASHAALLIETSDGDTFHVEVKPG